MSISKCSDLGLHYSSTAGPVLAQLLKALGYLGHRFKPQYHQAAAFGLLNKHCTRVAESWLILISEPYLQQTEIWSSICVHLYVAHEAFFFIILQKPDLSV